ncbi:MAG: DUF1043 family protein [Gammaproteobacteria bacterium]|nr:DUF1043 family protein [Gammaproteobacteria bacterium]MDP2140204.1 DUF1043 family protein [Gammaproteobacteria bacterium]MDP2348080.1 DUF1043 family protein [Gammaproteobacteria bacterium]
MLWLTAFGCLAVGIAVGFVLAGRTTSNPEKINDLEQQLQELQRSHARYREEVSEHFSMTAELVQQMTDSYKDVYQHLATGAQDLCSGEVASKLLPASSEGVFGLALPIDNDLQAPKDYAPRKNPNQSGALAEDFGLEKFKESDKDYL